MHVSIIACVQVMVSCLAIFMVRFTVMRCTCGVLLVTVVTWRRRRCRASATTSHYQTTLRCR